MNVFNNVKTRTPSGKPKLKPQVDKVLNDFYRKQLSEVEKLM